jgi:endo-1,4-beta-xylanase
VSGARVGRVLRARNLAEPPVEEPGPPANRRADEVTAVVRSPEPAASSSVLACAHEMIVPHGTARNTTSWRRMRARARRDRVMVAEAATTPFPARATAATLPTPDGLDNADEPLWAVSSVPVGAAVEPDLLADDVYARTLVREFNAITPENAMKWDRIHPFERRWNFDPADQLVEFAAAHRMRIHGHTLVWHRQLAPWLTPALSRGEVVRALASHVETLVGRYAGRIAAWDVVNEAVADDGRRLRDTFFLRTYGAGYIAEAFRLAHAADPGARLYYNDYGAEGAGPKSDAVYALVRHLLDEGVPVHGVGLQMHLRATSPPEPAAITANVARLRALGLEVRISEMDVRIRRVRQDDPLARQRLVYRDAIAACVGTSGFTDVTFWGVTDAHSWIHRAFGKDAPLLFDRDYAPKPAYFGVRAALATRRKDV